MGNASRNMQQPPGCSKWMAQSEALRHQTAFPRNQTLSQLPRLITSRKRAPWKSHRQPLSSSAPREAVMLQRSTFLQPPYHHSALWLVTFVWIVPRLRSPCNPHVRVLARAATSSALTVAWVLVAPGEKPLPTLLCVCKQRERKKRGDLGCTRGRKGYPRVGRGGGGGKSSVLLEKIVCMACLQTVGKHTWGGLESQMLLLPPWSALPSPVCTPAAAGFTFRYYRP